jgi:predicted porin
MKNLIKILLTTVLFSSAVYAEDDGLTIKPSGRFDFTAGYLNNKGANPKEKVSLNKNNFGFLSTARFILTIQNKLPNNISYGAKIAVNTTSRSDRTTPSSLFFESDAGKWEIGSDKSAVSKMKITGYSQASATAGGWDIWVRPDIRDHNIQYVSNFGNFLDTKTRNVKDIEYSKKITYYTPELHGFQFGISYIPDTTNIGGKAISDPQYHLDKLNNGYKFDIKDGLGIGITKLHKFSEKSSIKLSLVGETGKVSVNTPTADQIKKDSTIIATNNSAFANLLPSTIKFKKLRTYTAGAELKYGKLALSGGYSNYEKSLTANTPLLDPSDRKKTYLYSAGVKYNFNKLSVSTNYFYSNNKKNTISATTIGTDYKLAPGILPYAEVTFYDTKGWYRNKPTDTSFIADNHNGVLFLVGTKLEF